MAKFITSLASLTIGNYDYYSPPPPNTIGGFSETFVGLHVGGWGSTLPLTTATTTTTSLALVYVKVQFYRWFNFYFSFFFFM